MLELCLKLRIGFLKRWYALGCSLQPLTGVFFRQNEPCECVRVALKLADDNLVLKVLTAYQGDTLVRTQIGYMLGAQRWTFPDAQGEPLSDLVGKDVAAGLTNDWLSEMYKALAKVLQRHATKQLTLLKEVTVQCVL